MNINKTNEIKDSRGPNIKYIKPPITFKVTEIINIIIKIFFGEFLNIIVRSIKLDKTLYSDNKNFAEA